MQDSHISTFQKIVIGSMLTAITIPFILLTDVYPFFRFGMFAEPVTQEIQMEQFTIRYIHQNQSIHIVDPAEIGLGSLSYLMRNYYYRQQPDTFLQNIHQMYRNKALVKEWQLLRITNSLQQPEKTDTVIVARFTPGL